VFTNQKLVDSLIRKISKVEKETLNALHNGRVEQEPALTDRLLGVMEYTLNNRKLAGIRWTVKTLTDRGRGSQESVFGADFMAALEISVDGYQVAKGFLAQSKLVEPSQNFSRSEATRLKEQCEKMLSFSQDSFVFLYSKQSGIVVVPATEILDSRDCNPHELMSKKMTKFYRDHFKCFIGDHGIRRATPQGLDELRQRFEARRLVLLHGSDSGEGYDSTQLNIFSQR
jgi:hypothetical protein